MSARQPRFEIVRTAAGWHARFRAGNGQVVWTTEVYTRRAPAHDALYHLGKFMYADSTPWPLALFSQRYGSCEVREVDERSTLPTNLDDAAALGQWAAAQPSIRKAESKIHAIRELRILTGAGLLQSKSAIEAMP